jgi:cyanophycinase
VEGATGIFVGGGSTPTYHDAIVPAAVSWLPELVACGVPYAGISAGAMIAADRAIVAGWKLRRGDTVLVICSEELAEEFEYLDVRPGLGLAPFAIDAHASQSGSPARVLHAVSDRLVDEGWAIDEETMIELIDGMPHVRGRGVGYHVRRDAGSLRVDIFSDDGGD